MKLRYFIILYTLSVFVNACSFLIQPNISSIESQNSSKNFKKEDIIPKTFQLHDVPHNPRKQEGTDCAPDSLRMVLNYRGKNVKEPDIVRQLTDRGFGGGTTFGQMQEITAKSYNLPVFLMNDCDLETIKAMILNKWPPIIGYRASGKYYHAVVVVGYDNSRRLMFVHDPNIVGVRKMRYSDLGGLSNDGVQRLSVLLVLPEGATGETLMDGLSKYIQKENLAKLNIYGLVPKDSYISESDDVQK